jgi:hypothetical protein
MNASLMEYRSPTSVSRLAKAQGTQMKQFSVVIIQDGHYLARCPRTGAVVSAGSHAEALAEIRRLIIPMVPA